MRYVCIADLKKNIFCLKNNLNQSYFKTQSNKYLFLLFAKANK